MNSLIIRFYINFIDLAVVYLQRSVQALSQKDEAMQAKIKALEVVPLPLRLLLPFSSPLFLPFTYFSLHFLTIFIIFLSIPNFIPDLLSYLLLFPSKLVQEVA